MSQVGWLWPAVDGWNDGEKWSHARFVEYATTYPADLPFTPEMLTAMYQPRERTFLSPTMLAGCPREVALRNLCAYYVDPFKVYGAYRGTIVHHMMEQGWNEPDAILERRLTCFLTLADGRVKEIRGQPDKVVPSQRLLIDYKTSDKMLEKAKPNWVWQLSQYRWMLYKHGFEIERAFVQLIHMKEPARLEVPLKSLAQTESYMRARAPLFEGPYDIERLPPVLDYALDADQAWKCKPRHAPGGGWCPVYDICMALAKEGL